MIQLIFKYEWKIFYRSKLQVAFYIFLFLAGVYAISYGYREIEKQKATIALIEENEKEQFSQLAKAFKADTTTKEGKAIYMRTVMPSLGRIQHKYNTIFNPTPLTAFSLGQRDLFPYYHKLNSHSLYMQVFKNEMINPRKLLEGNLDLAFVIIYLLPLFIIAMSYGLVSGEKEMGTFTLLKTGSLSLPKLFAYRIFFRFFLAAIPVLVLSFFAAWLNKTPLNALLFTWLIISLAYVAVWCSIVFVITSFNKASAFNAVAMLGVWLLFLIVIPALLNVASTNRYPINQTLISDAIRRVQLDESEHGRKEVFDKYYTLHPEYKPYDIESPYNMAKLYAMGGEMKDEENRPMIQSYYEQIALRDQFVSSFSIISPAIEAQQLLNYISGSDIRFYLDYNRQLTDFHWKIYFFYADPLYKNKTLSEKDYENRPSFNMNIKTSWNDIYMGVLFMICWVLFFLSIAFFKMRKI